MESYAAGGGDRAKQDSFASVVRKTGEVCILGSWAHCSWHCLKKETLPGQCHKKQLPLSVLCVFQIPTNGIRDLRQKEIEVPEEPMDKLELA